jgi:hypothetical protein
MLHRMGPGMARNGLDRSGRRSPFLGVKRTCRLRSPKSQIDPNPTSSAQPKQSFQPFI